MIYLFHIIVKKRKNDISYSNNNSGKFLYNISFNSNTKNINNRNNVLRHSITEKKMIMKKRISGMNLMIHV